MIHELENVVLTADLPERHLKKGDIGTVVMVHEGGKGYAVEFMTAAGDTYAVVTLLASQVRRSRSEMPHVRRMAKAH